MAKRRRNNKKWIIGGLILSILIIVGVSLLVVWNNKRQDDNKKEDEMEVIEAEKNEDTKKRNSETEEEYSERMADQKKIKQYEGEDPNKAEELTGVVTYAGVNGDPLIIGTNIDQFLGEGTCTLSLMRDGGVLYSAESNIMAEVSTSTCDGFNVPVSGLGKGMIDIIIKLSAGGKTGTIRGEVNIQ